MRTTRSLATCLALTVVFAAAGGFVVVTSGCAAVAGRCDVAADCALAVCVDGACVDHVIGETPDETPDEAPAPIELVHRLAPGSIDARVRTTPKPPPPPLNDQDSEADLPSSCRAYLEEDPEAASGFYSVRARSGEPVVVECDMTTDGGGWTIVADVERDGCPDGWTTTLFGSACDRAPFEQISRAVFPLIVDYTEMRGGARGWSTGDNNAFDVGILYQGAQSDSLYVDGLSLTVNDDGERNHLWTFAAGGPNPYESTACPSEPFGGGAQPPSDVVGAYSCDEPRTISYVLWDGDEDDEDAGAFTSRSAPQGDEIEARIMSPMLGVQSPVLITSLTVAVR